MQFRVELDIAQYLPSGVLEVMQYEMQ